MVLHYLLIIYFILVNMLSFLLMGIDKYRAVKHKWRIRVSTLFLFSVIGGSIGSLLGMFFFHHKTRQKLFLTGMPAILLLHIMLLLLYLMH